MQAAFNITENMDGSATLYVIEYFEASTNTMCASQTVEPSDSCVDELCTHFFDISSSSCDRSGQISVAVSAENSLGRGPSSTPIVIHGTYIKLIIMIYAQLKCMGTRPLCS